MARPQTIKFGDFKVFLGNDDATVFTAPCGFTQKALTISADVATENIPDCDDPDAPAWTGRNVTSLSASVSGSGVLAAESYDVWVERMTDAVSFPVRVQVGDLGWWQGLAILSNITHTANLGPKVEASVSLDSDGEWVWTPAP